MEWQMILYIVFGIFILLAFMGLVLYTQGIEFKECSSLPECLNRIINVFK